MPENVAIFDNHPDNPHTPRNDLALHMWAWDTEAIYGGNTDGWYALAPHERAPYYHHATVAIAAGWTPPLERGVAINGTPVVDLINRLGAQVNETQAVSVADIRSFVADIEAELAKQGFAA